MKTGLVFSGGGARGAYEVGVWKALEELNIKCDIVTGVSIGSINAALYSQGCLKEAEELWKNIDFNTVFSTENLPKSNKETLKKYVKSIKFGGLEPNNLKNNLIKELDLDKIYSSSIDYGLITVKYPKLKLVSLTKKEIKKEEFIDYLIASSTVYPVFKLKEIEESKYIDGGFKNSIPIDLAKKMGADKLIIVNISIFAKRKKIQTDENTILIKPKNDIGAALYFDKKIANKSLKYGYNDTMKTFKKLDGKKYTFKNLNKSYKKNKYIDTYDKYINTLEYLGKTFNLDDSKIYTIEKFNNNLYKEVIKIRMTPVTKTKEFLETRERIVSMYNKLIDDKKIRKPAKRYLKEYRAAYYLYINS